MTKFSRAALLSVTTLTATVAWAHDAIVVTATKIQESASSLPIAITPIQGEALQRRGAVNLRDLVPTVSGVEVQPGGDAGPAGSVVSMQGLAELDAYLLVQDGVPYGGSFNPATAVLDPINLDRVEVLKGAAPVSYGATSLVGVINLIHHDAGKQPNWAMLQGGTHSSTRAAFAYTLSPANGVGLAQSLLGSAENQHFSQDRGRFHQFHLLYRSAVETSIGRLHFDLEGINLNQRPYSPHPREGGRLSTRFVKDANANPIDALANQDRFQATLGLDSHLGELDWEGTASFARTSARNIRGFLREDFPIDGVTHNADGFRQKVRLNDTYLDTHFGKKSRAIDWLIGADALLGRGRQHSENFEYAVLPDGSNAPSSASVPIDEATALRDRRKFYGLYGQLIVRPVERLTLLGGLRLNRTVEQRCGGEIEGSGIPEADDCEHRSKTRLAGSAGASFTVLERADNKLVFFGDYRNTYKPGAIDFGPEAEAEILAPETTRTWEAGVKSTLADGNISLEAAWFDTRFNNLVIRENVEGLPSLANAGKSRLRGIAIEAHALPIRDLDLSLTYAHHLARFLDYARLRPDGSLQQLAGNRLELSPKDVASAVISYTPDTGAQFSSVLRYTGARFLNKSNTVEAGNFLTLDGRVGWRAKTMRGENSRWGLFIEGKNLTDRRDPVVESELGDAQFYTLSGRRVLATFELDL